MIILHKAPSWVIQHLNVYSIFLDDRCISDEEDNRNNSDEDEEENDEETSNTFPDDDESSIDICKQTSKSRHYKAGKSLGGHVDHSLLQINNFTGHKQHYTGSGGGRTSKPARIRTVLNEKQLQTLRSFYNNNPRPDAMIKEQLVEITGLNSRVIRVWFQNKRCKDKKKSMNGSGGMSYHQAPQQPAAFPSQSNFNGDAYASSNMLQLPLVPSNSQQSIFFENCY